jgi:hypothetical protein
VARTSFLYAWIERRLMDGGNTTTVAPAPFVAAYCPSASRLAPLTQLPRVNFGQVGGACLSLLNSKVNLSARVHIHTRIDVSRHQSDPLPFRIGAIGMGLKSPQYLAMEMLMKFMIAVIYLLALIACIFSIRFRTMRARDWIALAMVSFLGLGCFADFAVNWGWLDPPANMQELRIG